MMMKKFILTMLNKMSWSYSFMEDQFMDVLQKCTESKAKCNCG